MRIKNYDKGRKKEAQAQHNRISSKWGYACHLTLTPLFLPNFGDLLFGGPGRKHPGPTKIHPPFPSQQKNQKKLFSLPHFPSPPIITPTKCNVKDVQKKIGQLPNATLTQLIWPSHILPLTYMASNTHFHAVL